MMTTTTYQTIDTVYSADSVEWCPVEGFQDLLLCGTYQLEEKDPKDNDTAAPQVRIGRLYLYRLKSLNRCLTLDKVWEKDMPGILDIKWCNRAINGLPHIGLVNSVGQLQLYSVDNSDDRQATCITEAQLCDDCLGLSLDWNNVLDSSLQPQTVASDSTGAITLHRVGRSDVEKIKSWKAHDFEAWITAFNHWDPNTVFSGGDDCLLKGWDLRTDTTKPVLTSKRHTMGVCSIQSSPVHEHILATGSYDEQLLVWDSRQMRKPLTDIGLGGGIWRIKWEPTRGDKILTATMYNGFHIIDTKTLKDGCLQILKHFQEHESIGYGADWCRLHRDSDSGSLTTGSTDSVNVLYNIATCSFYDHSLRLWDFQIQQE